jgi:phosphatidylinositol 3-kinase
VNLLGDFLVDKALEWPSFAQLLFWQLKVRSKEISAGKESRDNIFARLLGLLLHRFQKTVETAQLMQSLFKQEHLFKKMSLLFRDTRLVRLNRHQRMSLLKEVTSDPKNGILSFTTLSLPYDVNIKVTGTLPDKLLIFKSTAMPVKVTFVTTDINEHSVIVKAGEDMRQDALILGVLRLMDVIWKRNCLELKVTPYRCIALSLTEGMLEFIPSEPLSKIIAAYGGSVLAYLSAASMNPSLASLTSTFDLVERSSSGGNLHPNIAVPGEVLDNFVKSCAGYCVFTYVLGIGDRHLDNLLLTRDGRIFHVDFSYLFGNDPKPFPPPMKLCKEMVETMGGPTGPLFHRFKLLCFAAFSLLRRHARLLISFLAQCSDPGGTRYVHDRLMLDLEELDALLALERLIDESMTALFPKVFETLHKWAQYWRR